MRACCWISVSVGCLGVRVPPFWRSGIEDGGDVEGDCGLEVLMARQELWRRGWLVCILRSRDKPKARNRPCLLL